MGADSLAENTPNALEFICPSPKVLDFNEKKNFINSASVVRVCYLGFGFFVKLTQEGTGST